MNLLKLLGAAVTCPDFCNLLFDDPVLGAQLLGFTLTQYELDVLKQSFNAETHDQICASMGGIRALICKKPPCNLAPVIPGRGDLCAPPKAA